METVRIFLAMSNDASIGKLRTLLTASGHTIIDYARDGHECLRKIRALKPDLAILEYNLPLLNGYEVAKVACEDKICDTMLIVSVDQENIINSTGLEQGNGFAYMTKPINKNSFINTIELIVNNSRKIKELEHEIQELRNSLNTRKEVEKAKGLLMKHLGLSEPEAFKRIQKQSMDRGIPIKDIARAIVLAYDL